MRRAMDNYATPSWVTEALLRHHPLMGSRILEPCAGDGAIIEVIKRHNPAAHVTAVEIREEERSRLQAMADEVHIADFLTWTSRQRYDVIITNPPFSLAREIIERALAMVTPPSRNEPPTEIIMLLRLGFLESGKRLEFWRRHPLNSLYVLADRPSFTGSGTDATAYGWFIWNPYRAGQKIKVIGRAAA